MFGATSARRGRAGGGGTGLVMEGMVDDDHDTRSGTSILSLAELSIDMRAALSADEL